MRNRVLEVDSLKNVIVKDFKLLAIYHFVNDMITRGLSYNKYLSKFKFWNEGP